MGLIEREIRGREGEEEEGEGRCGRRRSRSTFGVEQVGDSVHEPFLRLVEAVDALRRHAVSPRDAI